MGPRVGGVDVRYEAEGGGDFHVDSDAGAAFPGADGGEVEEVGGGVLFFGGW